MKHVIITLAVSVLASLASVTAYVHHYDDAGTGCWHEVNKQQPYGVEKVCNHQ